MGPAVHRFSVMVITAIVLYVQVIQYYRFENASKRRTLRTRISGAADPRRVSQKHVICFDATRVPSTRFVRRFQRWVTRNLWQTECTGRSGVSRVRRDNRSADPNLKVRDFFPVVFPLPLSDGRRSLHPFDNEFDLSFDVIAPHPRVRLWTAFGAALNAGLCKSHR